jgi:oligogalacturonide lyase
MAWYRFIFLFCIAGCVFLNSAQAQIGKRFPSERKVVKDPVTGVDLIFLTSRAAGDAKIYQTHNQWTSDGKWIIFRSSKRAGGEAMAVNEQSGEMVQVTEGGYTGMLNVARKSMKLYFMRAAPGDNETNTVNSRKESRSLQIIEVDLEQLFADSQHGRVKPAGTYQSVCGTTPVEMGAGGDMALDANEDWVYFRISKEAAARRIQPGRTIEPNFGPRNMGAGPSGIAAMNVHTGQVKYVTEVGFQVGHIQTNPWVAGEIVFCWETGGKSPQRIWTVKSDGTGFRPVYPEAEFDWVTHEAVITRDEVAFAIMGHRKIPGTTKIMPAGTEVSGVNPGQEPAWGISGTREKPTGLGIVNLRTREMVIAGQIPTGSGFWHVSGSADGKWAVGDDFSRSLYLINRKTGTMKLLSTGHKPTAADHPHPTFSPDGTKIQIQSAMLSEDGRTMNICVIPIPKNW